MNASKASVLVNQRTSVYVTLAGRRWTAPLTVAVTITAPVNMACISVTSAFIGRPGRRVTSASLAATEAPLRLLLVSWFHSSLLCEKPRMGSGSCGFSLQ